MRSREKLTNIDKRKLTYDKSAGVPKLSDPNKPSHPLDLPPEFESRISQNEYKKIKEAFFI